MRTAWLQALTAAMGLLGLGQGLANAGIFTNTATGGNWDAPASWTAGVGYPGSGDAIRIGNAGNITVASSQQFGSATDSSTWTFDGTVLDITGGSTLTQVAGSTFSVGTGSQNDLYLRGGSAAGRFLNLGTVVQNNLYRRLNLENGLTFENQGDVKFQQAWGSIAIDGTSSLFVNDGKIIVAERGYIGAKGAGATFTTFDGTTLKGVQIEIAADRELGLGYYVGQTGNGSPLGGQVKIDALTVGTGGFLSFGNVDMSITTPANLNIDGGLRIGYAANGDRAGGAVSLGGSAVWNPAGGTQLYGGSTLKLQGHSLTSAGILNFNQGSNANFTLDGGNGGRLVLQGNSAIGQDFRGVVATNGVTIENKGTLTFGITNNNVNAISLDATSTFFNNGGTITAIRAGGIGASVDGGVFTNYDSNAATFRELQINVTNSKTFSLGSAVIGGGYMILDKRLDGRVNFTSLNVETGSTLAIGRYSNLTFQGDFTSAGKLKFEQNSTFRMENDITVAFGEGLAWEAATVATHGHTLTLSASTNTVQAVDQNKVSGNGTTTGRVVNYGTYSSNIQWRGLTLTDGARFENHGMFTLTNWTHQGLIAEAGTTFLNAAGGTVLLAPGGSGGYANITGAGTFNNLGTLKTTGDTVNLNVTSVSQFSGSTLTGGTWHSIGANTVMNVKFSGRGNIAMLGANATVILENGGTIDAINAALTTVDGTFIVNGSSTFVDASGFTVGSTGRVGGSGTIQATVTANGAVSPGNSAGTLTVGSLIASPSAVFEIELGGTAAGSQYDVLAVVGSLDLGGAFLDISFLNGFEMAIQSTDTFVIMTAGTLSGSFGNLVDGQVFLGAGPERFTVTIDYDNGLVLLGSYTIPEPASALLLALGGLGLRRRRGRRG